MGVRSRMTWSATGTVMNFLENTLGIRLRVDGLDHLCENPTLFVVNHFTRAETFIVPYLLHKHRGESARTLAHHSLFVGMLGRYISRLGAVSIREEERDTMIVGDLMTGRKNWVIYPEGTMVKNKKFLDNGSFSIQTPEYQGPPRTGAAVLALQAETHRLRYLEALEHGDLQTMLQYEEAFAFRGPEDVTRRDLVVIPVNITYFPIRPEENVVSRFAQSLFSELPERLEEELKVEGRILLGNTDMNVYFGEPISLAEYLQPHGLLPRLFAKVRGEEVFLDKTLKSQKQRLTRAFMGNIYQNVEVNFDHLFCAGLLRSESLRVNKGRFHRAILQTLLELERKGLCRIHPQLYEECVLAASGAGSSTLQSIVRECEREGILRQEEDFYLLDRARFEETESYQDIRLRLTAKVIANEFEPLERCTALLERCVNQSPGVGRFRLSREIESSQQRRFEEMRSEYFEEAFSKDVEVGAPFDLWPRSGRSRAGVLLVHGYMAAPMEMRKVGESLVGEGFHCHAVRIEGHGTAPRHLADTKWQDWILSVHEAFLRMKCLHERVYLVGFSMGGLLALLKGSQLGRDADGVVAINPAIRLMDSRAGLAGAAMLWNGVLKNVNIEAGRFDYVENEPANPEINYSRNYIGGVRQLGLLIGACEEKLPKLECPLLVVQADGDPVVDARGLDVIRGKVGSERANFVTIEASSHMIVTDEHCGELLCHVHPFLNTLELRAMGVERLELQL
ncbi:alpha/beta fold hydrolase [Pelagicoccus mobilis]|uniref:alpha/beta fold hydrolase n=1 Tax=Pelagicoccus mobilis TaxID=415221 RepID=UPI002D7FC4E7|nr:alpha/beta fold hydrolase [Pelagicoccus mobilis]